MNVASRRAELHSLDPNIAPLFPGTNTAANDWIQNPDIFVRESRLAHFPLLSEQQEAWAIFYIHSLRTLYSPPTSATVTGSTFGASVLLGEGMAMTSLSGAQEARGNSPTASR